MRNRVTVFFYFYCDGDWIWCRPCISEAISFLRLKVLCYAIRYWRFYWILDLAFVSNVKESSSPFVLAVKIIMQLSHDACYFLFNINTYLTYNNCQISFHRSLLTVSIIINFWFHYQFDSLAMNFILWVQRIDALLIV